ncbi:MAG: hypothetical protein AB7J35_06195 [Dehalococcoidia bacterium]
MKNQKLLSLGVAAVAVASIGAGSLLFTGGSDNSASALGLTDSQVQTIAQNVAATPQEERDAYLQKIADNLGVDLAKLKEAIGKANVDTLGEKVADGSITQERADSIRDKIATGDNFFIGGRGPGGPGGHGEFGRGGPGFGGPGFGMGQADVAGFLGIDEATLMTELQTKSLATIATEHGKTVDELKTFLTSSAQAKLADAVAAGKLTQEQADAALAELSARLDEEINEVHAPGEMGPRGMHPDFDDDDGAPTAPSAAPAQ